MTTVPVFNLDNNVTDEASIQSLLDDLGDNNGGGGGKVFRPGKHTVKIASVDYAHKKDSNDLIYTSQDGSWVQMQIVLEGTGEQAGKQIYKFLSVPTKSLAYTTRDGKESAFPVKMLIDLFNGLGIEATVANLLGLVNEYLTPSNLGKLVGRETIATIGYNGAHAQGRKGENGILEVVIMQKGEAIKDDTGTVLTFTGDDAFKEAGLYAKKANIVFASFPEVKGFESTGAAEEPTGDWT